ncbi:MAG: magnesium-translocating P-type ATPase [Candidatus Nomurabacteria bacterium]|nr:magnesium-translocating P-type ATPase [Candidatus Nomurabacteria bacterium]
MNWHKHIFRKSKEADHTDLSKNELFDKLRIFAKNEPEYSLKELSSSNIGLNDHEAKNRIKKYGLNDLANDKKEGPLLKLFNIIKSPINLLLIALSVISLFVGDIKSFVVIILMVTLSASLSFYQETKSAIAVDKLKSIIHTKSTVIRNNKKIEILSKYVVPGDIVCLYSGTIIPGDIRLITSKDLFINQAMLTGESLPAEKHVTDSSLSEKNIIEFCNLCFLGTSVESGVATAVVLSTGRNTYIGSIASDINSGNHVSDFTKELKGFVFLTLKFMVFMVPAVFLLNGIFKGNWFEAFLFALAVAVGMAPEMISTIVAMNLYKGALAMAKKKVIVKHLDAIENLGVMDVLCTDKTGTLTEGRVVLEKYLDIYGKENNDILHYGFLNSFFQTGVSSIIDEAVLKHEEVKQKSEIENYKKIDEIPFDFSRRRLSVIVSDTRTNKQILVCKGAVEEIVSKSVNVLVDGKVQTLSGITDSVKFEMEEELNKQGFRVVAVGYKEVDSDKKVFSVDDESDLILVGFLAFFDPPKASVKQTIQDLKELGVDIKILTGDNDIVTRKICIDVGMQVDKILLGKDIEKFTEEELDKEIQGVSVFAKLSPYDKERIIKNLRNKGHVVGFLGDGINDSLSLIAADIGISVDTAADIAKESSDIILLEKNLNVLKDGIKEGRRIFENIIKYIKMAASSNFGNMFSVVGASIFLPFLPMLPIQILANNMLYDFSQTTIPTDNVDEDRLLQPKKWDFKNIKRFIIFFGPISSLFDYATFFVLLYVFHAWNNPALFHTGWFVESLLTQTLIVHIIRTSKIPFLQSRASTPLIISTFSVIVFGIWLVASPFASAFQFMALPLLYYGFLFVGVILYFILTQLMKMYFIKKYNWI